MVIQQTRPSLFSNVLVSIVETTISREFLGTYERSSTAGVIDQIQCQSSLWSSPGYSVKPSLYSHRQTDNVMSKSQILVTTSKI